MDLQVDGEQDACTQRAACVGQGNGSRTKQKGKTQMNELFTYHDMFSSKGVEYLIIIVFLAIIVGFWMFVNMDAER